MKTKGLDYTVLTLLIIGAINWGLIGFFKFDFIAWLFGSLTMISRIIYAIIGLCGLYAICIFGRIQDAGE